MRLRHIEIFHAVYSTGSVSRAALVLNVSQPSVSKVLRHAEDGLGYALFDRVKGKMVPTPEAHALFVEVKTIHSQLTALESRARHLADGRSGHVRLAVMPALGLEVLPRAVAQFRHTYRDVTFEISTTHFSNILTALREQNCDIAVAFNPPPLAGVKRYKIGVGQIYCAHKAGEFGGRKALRFLDLVGRDIIGIKDSGPLSQLVTKRAQDEGVTLDAVITVQTYYIASNLVAHGAGVSLVDHLTARAGAIKGLEFTPLSPAMPYEMIGLVDENRPLSKVAERFMECFRAVSYNF
ncbi:LysR family transcriptional regulator [Kordiimonas aestuarii]|uniref:LysR family transcriptional regulator n=1 Tax=Kordiimonas aestuarii TaxID=1005925 RepID=UPI0021D35828|nr:LysR family transcriptional regulator [Kordiimonas aestuarii]